MDSIGVIETPSHNFESSLLHVSVVKGIDVLVLCIVVAGVPISIVWASDAMIPQ